MATGVEVDRSAEVDRRQGQEGRPSRRLNLEPKAGPSSSGRTNEEERRLGDNLMLHLSRWKRKPTRLAGEEPAESAEHRRPEERLRSSNFGV